VRLVALQRGWCRAISMRCVILPKWHGRGQQRVPFPTPSTKLGDEIIPIQCCGLWELDATTFGNPCQRADPPTTFGFSNPNPTPNTIALYVFSTT
jgi:hypothetical protein